MRKMSLAIIALLALTAIAAEKNDSYRGNTNSKVFHQSSCRYFSSKNCTAVFSTRDSAISAGYRPCKVCTP